MRRQPPQTRGLFFHFNQSPVDIIRCESRDVYHRNRLAPPSRASILSPHEIHRQQRTFDHEPDTPKVGILLTNLGTPTGAGEQSR